jgi:lysyl-tRNA synthetase class 1
MKYELGGNAFWLDETVDALFSYIKQRGISDDEEIICAAGMTPSCPIHFGIFREILISYFVSEEIKKRGRKSRLLYYWDDYDHFCKIPWFTTKEKMQEYIGKPLREVPDPGGKYPSYGEHYMQVFEENLRSLGVLPEYNYQSTEYASGKYLSYIRNALQKRKDIFHIISSVVNANSDSESQKDDAELFFPLEVYCEKCGRDTTKVTQFDEAADAISYECKSCNNKGSYTLDETFQGKLIWKVNWAMRWKDDNVLFESSGENQLTDTGSYAVSSKIASNIFNTEAPFSLLYRFIGMPGIAKVSRAQGEKTLSTKFIHLLEPAIIRWLFIKNSPVKSFTIDLENGLKRMYSEWDIFAAKIISGDASVTQEEKRIFDYATENISWCSVPISFPTVAAAVGICGGDKEKVVRILYLTQKTNLGFEEFREALLPRFLCAWHLIYTYQLTDDVPVLREKSAAGKVEMTPIVRGLIEGLLEKLHKGQTEEEVQNLLYALPKLALGVPEDDRKNPEVKKLQKEFYTALYLLFLGKEEGPKLSTILSLVDLEKIRELLTA